MNKHLKRLILVVLTLVMALCCLPVFSAFATEEADPTEPIAPVASLTIGNDKTLFKKNEAIPFVISGVGEKEELWILAPGQTQPALQEGEFNDETVELSFAISGKYSAYVMTWVGDVSQQSEAITFQVGTPTTATLVMNSEKTLFATEEEITFEVGGDGEREELWVLAPGQTKAEKQADLNDETCALSFNTDGEYKVYVLTWLDEEFLKSEEIAFHVGKPTISKIASLRATATIGETAAFPVEFNGTTWNATVIAPDGTETILAEQTGETFSVVLDQLGEYKMQVEAVNENGTFLSEEHIVTVYPPLEVETPDSNPNPTTSIQKGPLPPDYTGLIVFAVIVVILGLIALVIFLKINKKKKRKQQLAQ